MKQRSLSLDDIPVPGRTVRTEHLGRPCLEVADNGVHGNTTAADQDAGLTGGAEVCCHATILEFARDGEGRRAGFCTVAAQDAPPEPGRLDEVQRWLRCGDFADTWHAQVYTAMLERHAARAAIDPITATY